MHTHASNAYKKSQRCRIDPRNSGAIALRDISGLTASALTANIGFSARAQLLPFVPGHPDLSVRAVAYAVVFGQRKPGEATQQNRLVFKRMMLFQRWNCVTQRALAIELLRTLPHDAMHASECNNCPLVGLALRCKHEGIEASKRQIHSIQAFLNTQCKSHDSHGPRQSGARVSKAPVPKNSFQLFEICLR